jgi:hypothetical protein
MPADACRGKSGPGAGSAGRGDRPAAGKWKIEKMSNRLLAGLAGMALAWAGVSAACASPLYYIVEVPADANAGIDTGLSFVTGHKVEVKAGGYISVAGTQPEGLKPQPAGSEGYFSPAGALGTSSAATATDCQLGSLIGTIAGTGVWHCLGRSASFVADGDGDLVLAVNDWTGGYANNLGAFDALVLKP